MNEIQTKIQIIRTPEGEAPEWAREAWVGLELPCLSTVGYRKGKGVVTLKEKERNSWGYAVPQKEALEILARHNMNAAMYWAEVGYPKDDPEESCFFFAENEATVVQGKIVPQKIYLYDEEMRGDYRR